MKKAPRRCEVYYWIIIRIIYPFHPYVILSEALKIQA